MRDKINQNYMKNEEHNLKLVIFKTHSIINNKNIKILKNFFFNFCKIVFV
jgi:hypothetical protein